MAGADDWAQAQLVGRAGENATAFITYAISYHERPSLGFLIMNVHPQDRLLLSSIRRGAV